MSRPYERGDQSQRTARYNGAQCGAAKSRGAEERYLYTRERYNTRLLGLYPRHLTCIDTLPESQFNLTHGTKTRKRKETKTKNIKVIR